MRHPSDSANGVAVIIGKLPDSIGIEGNRHFINRVAAPIAHQMLAENKDMYLTFVRDESSRSKVPVTDFVPHIGCHVVAPCRIGSREVQLIEIVPIHLEAEADGVINSCVALHGVFDSMVTDSAGCIALRPPNNC